MFKAGLGLIAFLGTYFLSSPLSAEIRKLQPGAGPAAWTNDLSSIARSDWTYERAAHLLERAGFGGTPQEVDKLARMTPEQAVEYLVTEGGMDREAAKGEAAGAAASPGQKICYTLGKWQIQRLLGLYRDARGAAFTLAGFHDELLSHGSLPVSVLEWLMLNREDTWKVVEGKR